jgi:ABC-type multidrug transport system ATPase subunit
MGPRVTIEADNLVIRYADLQALEIRSLYRDGGVFALLGHNGAGKSTFIKTLLGLLEPHSGSVVAFDSAGRRLVPERDMAFCPENGAVFADIVVEEYLRLWCRIKHNDPCYYKQAGAHYVERLALRPLLRKRGRELSKGQRRRVQTALGFMSNPRFFLFDEPFDGLDVQRTNELMEIVEEERDQRAFLISSHRMDVMERLADTIVVLQEGQVRCDGQPEAVCEQLVGNCHDGRRLSLTDAMRYHLQRLAA